MTRALHKIKEFLSRSEVAALFKVSPNTITRWAEAGKLPYSRTLGGHRRYAKEAVQDLARTFIEEENHVEVTAFYVPRMYGDHHVTAVHRILSELSGVEDVWASAALQQVQVTYNPDVIGADEIRAELEETGYPAMARPRTQASSQGDKDPAWNTLALRMTQTYGAQT